MLMPYSIVTYADLKTIQLSTVRLHVQNLTSIKKVSARNKYSHLKTYSWVIKHIRAEYSY